MIIKMTSVINKLKIANNRWPIVIMIGCVGLFAGCSQVQDVLDDLLKGDSPSVPPPAYLDLPGSDLFPEGIVTAANGDIFVTGFGNGSVLRIIDGKEVEFFKRPGEDGLSSAVGLAIDEVRRRLWVANFFFDGFSSDLKVFDLDDGTLLATLTNEIGGISSFFNELAIDAEGNVYISDTSTPSIWVAKADLSAVELLVVDDLLENPDPNRQFGLNGLALTPDGNYLIASVMDRISPGGGRLVRVSLHDPVVSDITLNGLLKTINTFGGSDGMFFEQGQLFMVNVTPPTSIMTARFNQDFTEAELVARDTFEPVYNRPTASAIRDGRLWTVNSQLDHIIDDGNGALNTPPELPFQLVNVSLKKTLSE